MANGERKHQYPDAITEGQIDRQGPVSEWPPHVKEPSRSAGPARRRVPNGVMADVVFVLLIVAFFAGVSLLARGFDHR